MRYLRHIERGVTIGAEKGQAAQAIDLMKSTLSRSAAEFRSMAKRARSRLS